ncbi:glycosyltransferase family 2 protein [Mangrovibacter plantisponsor]|uniref:Dolichol-phosphate mannosyltransferase n=1 Tax=Mangrovibacter plantisponsor TaxID=451513 RepID=A0A317Q5Q6_9ENTR|nr:glycosyltransferase family 2 protein [Mangrovibacter plantisponsor]PWW11559.1 dolichol-phosphate mannosyltransferase [Mangrovibacter plantisponsor]
MNSKKQSNEAYIPDYDVLLKLPKKYRWCVVIPVINEGERIHNLLEKILKNNIHSIADIIIVDGGSTDGSLDTQLLVDYKVSTLLQKRSPGKLSVQLLCAYDYALRKGYDGIVTIDGNDKDDPISIPDFIAELDNGLDFVQASRFLDGGIAVNTPVSRDLAIRFIHAPVLSFFSGFKWTDTTQGFRAYSSKMLLDPRISIFRSVFKAYELLAYLSYRAPKLNFKCKEIPTTRRYPEGDIPTKISGFKGNCELLKVLFFASLGIYNP